MPLGMLTVRGPGLNLDVTGDINSVNNAHYVVRMDAETAFPKFLKQLGEERLLCDPTTYPRSLYEPLKAHPHKSFSRIYSPIYSYSVSWLDKKSKTPQVPVYSNSLRIFFYDTNAISASLHIPETVYFYFGNQQKAPLRALPIRNRTGALAGKNPPVKTINMIHSPYKPPLRGTFTKVSNQSRGLYRNAKTGAPKQAVWTEKKQQPKFGR